MTDTLIIIPTKNRPEYLNCLIQNLITQEGDFDIYIADMCDDAKLLYNNWLLRSGLERLRDMGHYYMVETVSGTNQCDAYNAGLRYASSRKYTFCLGCDDDIILEAGWVKKGRQNMIDDPNLGLCAGITLDPGKSRAYQTIGTVESGLSPDTIYHPDLEGKLIKGDYYHCIYIPPTLEPRYYEVLYGMAFFRAEDAVKVGGFPTFLSPLGFRGEMYMQAIDG
jgi:glycosyltransferase involved in cell wall biosynthesis